MTAQHVAAAPATRRPRRPIRPFVSVVVIGLCLLLVAGLLLGTVSLPLFDTIGVLGHRLLGLPAGTWAASTETIVMELRLPRVLGAMVVGAGLGISGAVLQGLLRNPLADPYVLGTASGAALGAAVGILLPVQALLLGFGITGVLAFLGALAAVALVVRLAGAGTDSRASVLLVGYAVGSVLAAGLALAMYLSGDDLRRIVAFLLGSFADVTWSQVAIALPVIVAGTLLIVSRARSLDAMLLGDDAAAHLGIDVRRERRILLALSALVTAMGVAMAGLIGFVGLVVPHVVRLVAGPSARSVLPLSALVGAAFMVGADLIARIPGELPVGIVTALVGVPVFLVLLRRARGAYEL
ncbi:MAG: iron ABC transporter permease [Candidatus Limnocylindrales bacterium]